MNEFERTDVVIITMLVHKKTQRQVQWTIQETEMFVLQQYWKDLV